MPIAVRTYTRSEEGKSKQSGHTLRHAIPYSEIMGMTQETIKKLIREWEKKEAEARGRKDVAGKAALKIARLNLKRLTRRYAAVFRKLPHPDNMPVDRSGKTFRCVAPLPWADEERLDEELFLKAREKRIAELISLIRSDNLIKVEIEFKHDQAYFEFVKQHQIIREEKVSDLMTMSEAREILRAGTESFLGNAFRALLTHASNK